MSVSPRYLSRRFSVFSSFRIGWHQSQSFHLTNWTLTYSECRGLMLHCDTSILAVLFGRKKLWIFTECYFCLLFFTVFWWFHQVPVTWCQIGYFVRIQHCLIHIWTHLHTNSAFHSLKIDDIPYRHFFKTARDSHVPGGISPELFRIAHFDQKGLCKHPFRLYCVNMSQIWEGWFRFCKFHMEWPCRERDAGVSNVYF